ncbi:MAG: helix-turn-helix domain-containing protein [Candidatus Hydrogenedentes bacterium]|nr:helix-turn-helix domain-containing protein [Candidatus Hydrogenedentota bacterium]
MLNTFVDFALATVERTDAAVWLVLYRDTRRDGIARTSKTAIARRAGVGIRTVARSVKRLEASGLLRVVRRGGLNRGPSAYRVQGVPNE